MRKKIIKVIIEFMLLIVLNYSDRQTFNENVYRHQDIKVPNIGYHKNVNISNHHKVRQINRRIPSTSPFKPMKDGEYLTFRRRRRYRNCNMKDSYFTVLKVEESESFIFYAVAGDFENAKFDELDDDPHTNYRYNHQIAFIKCFHGWIDDLQVFDESLGDEEPAVDARRCGIGTVLSELCLIDPEIYDPKPSNMAIDELKNKYYATNEFEMVKRDCIKLVGLTMKARVEDPEQLRAGGHAYLTAALNMRYGLLLVEAGRITGSGTSYSDQK